MNILESLVEENKRLVKDIKIKSEQISIAIQGLEALLYSGDIGSIAKKTLTEIKSLTEQPEDLPQESNKGKNENIE